MLQKPIDHRELLLEICRVLEKKHGRAPMPREPVPDPRRAWQKPSPIFRCERACSAEILFSRF